MAFWTSVQSFCAKKIFSKNQKQIDTFFQIVYYLIELIF